MPGKTHSQTLLLGPLATVAQTRAIPPHSVLITIDGGTRIALASKRVPTLAVGDWDSLGPSAVKLLAKHSIPHITLRKDKDRSDTWYALQAAIRAGARDVIALGLTGGRPDHHLAVLLDFADAAPNFRTLSLRGPEAEYHFVSRALTVRKKPGQKLFSVFALPHTARGVTLTGAKYPLRAATLEPSSHGLSNAFTQSRCRISVKQGTLLLVIPRHAN
jgi:thiamine pyrophosphokinase